MSLGQILLFLIVGGLFVVMMYMFIRVLFLPNPSVKQPAEKAEAGKSRATATQKTDL